MPYGNEPIDTDAEARKKKAAENPLQNYFGGPEQTAPAAAPQVTTAPGQGLQTPVSQAQAPHPNVNTGNVAATNAPGRAAGGFTSFGRVMGANKEVADREAKAYAARAQGKVDAAGNALSGLQARFGSAVQAGTVADPNAQVPGPGGTMNLNPMSGLPITNSQPGTQNGLSAEELNARGGAQYSGPNSLIDTSYIKDPVAKAAADKQNLEMADKAQAAQANLGALGDSNSVQALIQEQNKQGGQGTSSLSSSLIGGSGRKEFDALRGRFNPVKDFTKANETSSKEAKSAEDQSKKNAAEWKRLGDVKTADDQAKAQKLAKDQADKALAKDAATKERFATIPKPGPDRNNLFSGVDQSNPDEVRARSSEISAFRAATHRDAADAVKDAIGNMSLSERYSEANAQRNPLGDWFAKTIHGQAGKDSGSDTGEKIPWEPWSFWVYRQMDDKQWAELKRLPTASQRGWIQQRMDALSKEQEKKDGGEGWGHGTGLTNRGLFL